jgi:hypothetical protein
LSATVPDVPVCNAAADDFDGRQRIGGGAQNVCNRVLAVRQMTFEHERNLRLHLGLLRARERNLLAVGHGHVVEKHAEVGLVHAQLRLHRLRGQTDLAAYQPPTRREPVLRVDALHRVRSVECVAAQLCDCATHRRARRALRLRFAQPASDLSCSVHVDVAHATLTQTLVSSE